MSVLLHLLKQYLNMHKKCAFIVRSSRDLGARRRMRQIPSAMYIFARVRSNAECERELNAECRMQSAELTAAPRHRHTSIIIIHSKPVGAIHKSPALKRREQKSHPLCKGRWLAIARRRDCLALAFAFAGGETPPLRINLSSCFVGEVAKRRERNE